MQAAGAYLRALRDADGATQQEIADRLGISLKTVQRIEGGDGRTLAPTLAAFVTAVKGNAGHVLALINSVDATTEAAERLATEWHAEQAKFDQAERNARTARAQALIAELEADPRKLDRLLGYGERLIEEDRRSPEP